MHWILVASFLGHAWMMYPPYDDAKACDAAVKEMASKVDVAECKAVNR